MLANQPSRCAFANRVPPPPPPHCLSSNAPEVLASLRASGAKVAHAVDCTSPESLARCGSGFHAVVFNFPHVGGST